MKFLIIDAHHYLHRAYHALPKLQTKNGEEVGALFGFIKTVLKLIKQFKPTHLAVCWDSKPVERLALEPQYKAHRPPTPDSLKTQIAWCRELVQAWGLGALIEEGFEADDLMAALAKKAKTQGFEVVIVTSDKDALQCVDDNIKVFVEHRQALADSDWVKNRYGVAPDQMGDYLALIGDATDNIKGVPGIGEKTAKNLIQKFGSAADLLSALEDPAKEIFLKNKKLTKLNADMDFVFESKTFALKEVRPSGAFKQMLVRFGFISLLKEFGFMESAATPLMGNAVYDFKKALHADPNLKDKISGELLDIKTLAWMANTSEESYDLNWLLSKYGAADGQDLALKLKTRIAELGLWPLYEEVEKPFAQVLYEMEVAGIAIDKTYLEKLGADWQNEINSSRETALSLANVGQDFNLNSPKQLAVLLFEKLNLPKIKKIKTGYSTDEETLLKLRAAHPFVDKLLEYRELAKLQSTYAKGLREAINLKTGRIHATFNQEGTQTGRLSCANPNLQNIPVRTERGQKIRQAFIPGQNDWLFLSLDYSQIDLRVLAHLSQDANLIKVFVEGGDIHEETASALFSSVGPESRRRAKAVNFGIVYGMSAWGLARELAIDSQTAQTFIDLYFTRFAGVKAWMEKTINDARRDGYVATILGRRRYLPNINHPKPQLKEFSERVAVNTPVQGASADLIKIAMVKMSQYIHEQKLALRMLVQIHDEILLEGPAREIKEQTAGLKKIMETAMTLRVPLVVNAKIGKNWQEMTPSPTPLPPSQRLIRLWRRGERAG